MTFFSPADALNPDSLELGKAAAQFVKKTYPLLQSTNKPLLPSDGQNRSYFTWASLRLLLFPLLLCSAKEPLVRLALLGDFSVHSESVHQAGFFSCILAFQNSWSFCSYFLKLENFSEKSSVVCSWATVDSSPIVAHQSQRELLFLLLGSCSEPLPLPLLPVPLVPGLPLPHHCRLLLLEKLASSCRLASSTQRTA